MRRREKKEKARVIKFQNKINEQMFVKQKEEAWTPSPRFTNVT